MSYTPLTALPGVCKVDSAYMNSIKQAFVSGRGAVGRYTDMNKMRFVAGFPEKIGGRVKATTTQLTGVPRGIRDWRDNNQVIYLGIGTNKKLYIYSQNAVTDITPLRSVVTGTLTNPFTTTNGSASVSVAHTSHGLKVNDFVMFTSSAAVGGLTISGVYFVTTVTDANNYVINAVSTATSGASGGGTVSYTYYRITLTNPFSTVSGSSTVTVAHSNHGAGVGDYVTISDASAVGGLTLSGQYVITSVAANTYTITAGSNASSTVSGGGGTPNFQYDISIGNADSAYQYGYGTGGYGQDQGGGYGTLGTIGYLLGARVWALDHYGQQLLANPYGGTIYVYDPVQQGRAYPLYGAPSICYGMFVTPERFVFALTNSSSTGNPMQVQWPDQNSYTTWTAAVTNTANARTLQNGNFLVNGCAVRDGVSMVWSNTTAFTFNYTGDNFVYASSSVGIGAGLVGPLAVVVIGGVAYWMGYNEFWNWNGSVAPLPSDDIRDYVYTNINLQQAQKFWAGANISKKEVWFGYCSANSTEVDSYVIYHIDQGCFSIGTWPLTSWADRGLFSNPMSVASDSYIYTQESGYDDNGSAMDSYCVFSPMDISKGDKNMDISGFIPDFERQIGNVSLTVNTQTYPQDTATANGPYTIADNDTTPIIDLRLGAKLVGFRLESNVLGGDMRIGLNRVNLQQAGGRR